MTLARARASDGPDVILLDTSWDCTDFLAYQLAKRGIRPHACTPLTRRPPYLPSFGYPYGSVCVQPDPQRTTTALLTMIDKVKPACIIPCGEQSLYWLWRQPKEIQSLCFPNVAEVLRPLLLNRGHLLEAASAWGVPVPSAMTLESREDCDKAIARGLPLIVKAARSINSDGVRFCETADEVRAAYDTFSLTGERIDAQRYYTGGTFLAGGFFVNGRAAHFYAGEKVLVWPRRTGPSLRIVTVGEPRFSALLRYVEAVCQQLDWTGLASFDFVLDKDTDELRMVDFNPRHWGAAGATLRSGVDLYDGLAQWIREGTVTGTSRSVPGISYRVFPKHLFLPSDIGWGRRLLGVRDAPWQDTSFVLGELAFSTRERLGEWGRRMLRSRRPGGEAGDGASVGAGVGVASEAGAPPAQPTWPGN
jgi:hypothetical protein